MINRFLLLCLTFPLVVSSSALSIEYKSSNPMPATPEELEKATAASAEDVVQILSHFVYELPRPYYVWNWFNATGRWDGWTSSSLTPDSPDGFDHLQKGIKRYWQELCITDKVLNELKSREFPNLNINDPLLKSLNAPDCEENPDLGKPGQMMGPGFYVAVDPFATEDFGRANYNDKSTYPGWVLTQIQLPKGFRVMDSMKDWAPFPIGVQKYFSNLGCRITRVDDLERLTSVGRINYFPSSPLCRATVRKLMKDVLKVDAVMYDYLATFFPPTVCRGTQEMTPTEETKIIDGYLGPFHYRSMVITNASNLLKPEHVKVFNEKTTGEKENRKMIQLIFDYAAAYKNSEDKKYTPTLVDPRAPARTLWADIPSTLQEPFTDIQKTEKWSVVSRWLQDNIFNCKDEAPYTRRESKPGF
jgi:hypothetical protein